MNSEQELVFAKLLVSRGMAAVEALKEALREQTELANAGREVALADLLVGRGLFSRKQLDEILADFESNLRRCEACGAFFYRSPEEPPATLCRKCSGVPARGGAADATAAFRAIRAGAEAAPRPPPSMGVRAATGALPATSGAAQTYGDYEILETVARGGMGIVYKARHRTLGRVVALKVLREGRRSSEDHVKRFKREAQSVAKLRHPNIVQVHEFGYENSQYFFTMDFVEGESFEAFLARPNRDTRRGVEILRDIARAIEFAHRNGIIHRDIKPANILIDCEGRAQITDFGLARNVDNASALTQEGELLGTPLYMSPEQVRGRVKEVDARSDVYALGVILYQHLAGQLPFLAQTMVELQWKVVNEEPRSIRSLNPAVDAAIEAIASKCLEKNREDRYQTAGELADDLDRWLLGKKVRARPLSMPERIVRRVRRNRVAAAASCAALALLLVGGGVLGILAWQERSKLARAARERALAELDSEIAQIARAAAALLESARASLAAGDRPAAERDLELAAERLAEAYGPAGARRGIEPADLAAARARHEIARLARERMKLSVRADAAAATRESLERAAATLDRLLALSPEHGGAAGAEAADAWLSLARVRRDLSDLDGAEEAARRALELDPQSAAAHGLRGEVARARGRWKEAEEEFGAALATAAPAASGEDPVLRRLDRAIARYHLGDDAGAAADLKDVTRMRPTEARAHIYLGEIAARAGQRIQAEKAFDRAVELAPESPEAYLHRGRFALRMGDYVRARDDLQRAIDEDDTLVEAYLWHGIALYHLAANASEEKRAKEDLSRAADDPGAGPAIAAEALRSLGRLLRAAGQPEEAIVAYERATKLDAHDAAALTGLGRALLDAGRAADAEKALGRALDEASGTPALFAAAHTGLGLAALVHGRENARAALEHFDRALEVAPRDPEALAGRGEARMRLGMTKQAADDFRAALAGGGEAADVRWFVRQGKRLEGLAARTPVELDRTLKLEQAIRFFDRATRLMPLHARAHIERAKIFDKSQRFAEARAACGLAIEANPCAAEAYAIRGRIRTTVEGLLDLDGAVADLTKALDLGWRDYHARYWRGVAYMRKGDTRASLADLEKVAEQAPGDDRIFAQLIAVYTRLGNRERAEWAKARHQELTAAGRGKRVESLRAEAARTAAYDTKGAIKLYTQAIALAEDDGTLYLERARLYLRGLETPSAVDDYARAIELRPELAGKLYEDLQQLTELYDSRRALELVASESDGGADGRSEGSRAFLRGFIYVLRVEGGQGSRADALQGIEEFTAALEEDPTSAAAYVFRGLLALRSGDLKSAKEDLGHAIVLENRCAVARVYMAGVYAQEEIFDLAFEYLRQAIDQGFRDWAQLARDEALAPLKLDKRWRPLLKGG